MTLGMRGKQEPKTSVKHSGLKPVIPFSLQDARLQNIIDMISANHFFSSNHYFGASKKYSYFQLCLFQFL